MQCGDTRISGLCNPISAYYNVAWNAACSYAFCDNRRDICQTNHTVENAQKLYESWQ